MPREHDSDLPPTEPFDLRARAKQIAQHTFNKLVGPGLKSAPGLLIAKQQELIAGSKERRKITELITAQQRIFEAIVKLSPEERTSYFGALKTSGIPEALAYLSELDQQVMSEYPDAEQRKNQLNAQRSMQRALRNGRGSYMASRAYQVGNERSFVAARDKELTQEIAAETKAALEAKVCETLELTGGNKTQAARLLGLSRDKVQRLSGVEHR